MLKLRKLYSDRQFDIYAIDVDDRCFVEDFIKGLQESARKKIVRLLSNTAKTEHLKMRKNLKNCTAKRWIFMSLNQNHIEYYVRLMEIEK